MNYIFKFFFIIYSRCGSVTWIWSRKGQANLTVPFGGVAGKHSTWSACIGQLELLSELSTVELIEHSFDILKNCDNNLTLLNSLLEFISDALSSDEELSPV